VGNQAAFKWMLDLYRSRFENLSKHIFDLTIEEASVLGIPDFGEAKFENVEMESFMEDLTFMMNDFSNFSHR
jgi:hypothetical protein